MRQVRWAVIAGALALAGTASAQQGGGAAGGNEGGKDAGASGANQGAPQSGMMGKAERGAKSEFQSVRGTVENVQGNTLTLKNRLNQTHDFQLSDSTKYEEHGKQVSKDNVKPGDEVRAAFRTEPDGKLSATSIRILRTGEQQGTATGSSTQSEPQSGQSEPQSGQSEQQSGQSEQQSGQSGQGSSAQGQQQGAGGAQGNMGSGSDQGQQPGQQEQQQPGQSGQQSQ